MVACKRCNGSGKGQANGGRFYNNATQRWDFVTDGNYQPCRLCKGSGVRPPKLVTANVNLFAGVYGLLFEPFDRDEEVVIIPKEEYDRLTNQQ